MNATTLVHYVHLKLNITYSKWGVRSAGLFAGTFASLVFIWRCAILVDSLDTLSKLVRSDCWHRAFSSNSVWNTPRMVGPVDRHSSKSCTLLLANASDAADDGTIPRQPSLVLKIRVLDQCCHQLLESRDQ